MGDNNRTTQAGKDSDLNEIYLGRSGAEPPGRTTAAPAGGIPGNSRVEIDRIAYI